MALTDELNVKPDPEWSFSGPLSNDLSDPSLESDGCTDPVDATPESKKRAAAVSKSQASPSKKVKVRKSSSPSGAARKRSIATQAQVIPRSMDEMSDSDKLLWTMREENKSWAEIHAACGALTGRKVSKDCIRKRYTFMKANMTTFTSDDDAKLLAAKKEIEETLEKEKWAKIALAMEAQECSSKFTTMQVQKRFKELQKHGQTLA